MTDTFVLIAAQRLAVAEVLDGLDRDQWATPSLCEGWTVREVAAHLGMPFHVSLPAMMWRMAKARGDFDRVADGYARTAAARPASELVADLRAHAADRFTPPGAGPTAPLSDLTLHGLDIGIPVGQTPTLPDEALTTVLSFLVTKPATRGFVTKGRLDGLRFEATDVDWSAGDGAALRGPGTSLALAIAGRPHGLDELDGDGVATLRARLA